MPAEVVILGGGVGGTLTANLLSKSLGKNARVRVVDPSGMHIYQPAFLYVALGHAQGLWLARDERDLLRDDVDLIVQGATKVDADEHRVTLDDGSSLNYDYLVASTGARLLPDS